MIMTAAVDMKPALTIIKAEKMDGEYQQLPRGSSRGVVSPPVPPSVDCEVTDRTCQLGRDSRCLE